MVTDNGVDIHITESIMEEMRRRGHAVTGRAIVETVIKWQGLMNEGERELAKSFTPGDIAIMVEILVAQAKADRLTHREFWGLGAERLGEMVRLHNEKLGERMVRLGELAALALKERIGGVIVFPPGTGGRPRGSETSRTGNAWPKTDGKEKSSHRRRNDS